MQKDELALVKELLRKNRFKLTKQRELILEQFFLTDKHLTAEEIYQRLENNNIGLATIYGI